MVDIYLMLTILKHSNTRIFNQRMSILQSKKTLSDCFEKIETICGVIPACLKTILRVSGFDTMMSLQQLNSENLYEIEEYINGNEHILMELRCCQCQTYRYQSKFSFLPGHRCIILNLPIFAAKIPIDAKTIETKKSRKVVKFVNQSKLKENLINKLVTYVQTIGLGCEETLKSQSYEITDCGAAMYQCAINCPICKRKYSATYKHFWKLSNIFTHLKKHVEHKVSDTRDDEKDLNGEIMNFPKQINAESIYGADPDMYLNGFVGRLKSESN